MNFLIRLARQISVPTDKDLGKPLILRMKMKTATHVLMVSTLLHVVHEHIHEHIHVVHELFDI